MAREIGNLNGFRAADSLAAALEAAGVRHVFGMPGSHTTTVYDALAQRPAIQTILTRNEQAGAFMADGYARVTGRPGVVCTTAGPGATNALTGVAEAWADSVPLVLLAGQVNSDRLDVECGAYHEIDLESIFRPVTKFCVTVRDPGDTAKIALNALAATTHGRPRPAAVFLPQDLMKRGVSPYSGSVSRPVLPDPWPPEPGLMTSAARLLAAAERPIILAGGGAVASGAADSLRALAARLNAPIVTSLNGKGLIDERDPLSLGHARSVRGKVAVARADAMLAVGCRFTEVMTAWRTMPVPERLIQVDIDPDQLGMNHPVAVGIAADARAAVEGILGRLPGRTHARWGRVWDEARTAQVERPEWLIDAAREALPGECPVFTDACEMGYRMHTDWVVHGPRRFYYPSNYITLGWGFPAAVGAAVALGGQTHVLSVSGDGGFVMTAQELATCVRYSLPVIALVHNDSTYSAIKNIQNRQHEGRFRDVELNNPDFLALAAAYDVEGTRATNPDQLKAALRLALARRGPTLIEVPDTWRTIRP